MPRAFRTFTPRSFLVPIILVALGAPSSLIAGQAASALAGSSATHIAASSMAGMDMSAAPSLAKSTTVKMLHRKVIQITITNFAFSPASVEVSPGTKIIWTNHDSDPHTVDSTKNVWTSEALDTAGRFTRVFKKTGAFPYYCSIHPFMHATVIVVK